MTPQQQNVYEWLEHFGEKGATVFELIQLRCGTEIRKHVSDLRRMGYQIRDKWESKGKSHWKRYYLGEV